MPFLHRPMTICGAERALQRCALAYSTMERRDSPPPSRTEDLFVGAGFRSFWKLIIEPIGARASVPGKGSHPQLCKNP